MNRQQICQRCIYDDSISGITFDDLGICNYCHQVEELKDLYGTGTEIGRAKLLDIINKIKQDGKNSKYDCIVGVSGGTDSSFLLMKAVEWGLRPLAVHYDNTWNTAVATENIRKVTKALSVDLKTYVMDNKESDDIYRAFFKASVPEFDAATDLGFAQVIRMVAATFKTRYILEGHSFVAEGITPMSKNYFDGAYIKDIHNTYGSMPMRTYPLMTFSQFMKWTLIYRQKFVRPLWYLNYSKEQARVILKERFGWQDYGGHHLENRASAFVHQVYHPEKFKMDNRNWALAASVRAGNLSRDQALAIYDSPISDGKEIVEYVKKRLGLTDSDYIKLMSAPSKDFTDYKSYKRRFEALEPIFKQLADRNIVPRSFYLKYCFPIKK